MIAPVIVSKSPKSLIPGTRIAVHFRTAEGWRRQYTEATRDLLVAVQATGGRLGVETAGAWAYGTIAAINLESDFRLPSMPRHFIVTLRDDDGSESNVYVRTAA